MECWQCGAHVQPGDRTCGYCGAQLTSPPAGRSQRSSQQRYPSPRRPREDDWQPAADDESGYTDYDAYGEYDEYTGDQSAYGMAHRPDDRRARRGQSRSHSDDGWDDPEPDRRASSRGRSQAHQEQDEYGSYSQAGYGPSDSYDERSSRAPEVNQPDPMDDPRAPRNLRSAPRREPASRSGYPQDDAPRPSYGAHQGQGRSRRSQPSSADNRYSRPAPSRGQPAPYDDRYYDDSYGNTGYGDRYDGGYGDGYSDERQASQRGYGRPMPMPPDQSSSWYKQVGTRAHELQQRWGDTLSSMRIPGLRPQEESAKSEKSSGRRIVTRIVLLLVLVAALVGGGVVLVPRVMRQLKPSTGATNSALCTASGAATAGTIPTATANFKQFTSSRSGYGVNYPETWTVSEEQKAASGYDYIDAFTLPNSATLVNIEQPQAACALSDAEIIQGEVAAAQQQDITFTEVTSTARTQKIGGEQWQRREYDVSQKGVTLHMVILACHHQGRAYVIVLVSRTTTFAQDNTGIFQPMLDSFTFTK
ncbi:MAG TPA: zinc ribbon domain-containing protein [Ktedonobacterales bacterium]